MLILFDLDIPWEVMDTGGVAIWGILLQMITLLYAFLGLAIICDDHLVPALDTLVAVWQIPDDVAGATFMAFGSAAPEIVIAAVSTAQATVSTSGGDEDDITLGVSSVIGSGLIAFSLIPAVCGLSGGPDGLTLKRRPLFRDELGYLISLLALIYIISDGVVHAWEAAILLVIYIIYLLVIVFSHSVRVWYISEVLGQQYVSSANVLEEYSDENKYLPMDQDEFEGTWGEPLFTCFKTRPLPFTCTAGDDGEQNAIVANIDPIAKENFPELEDFKIGMQVMEINGESAEDLPFIEIKNRLENMNTPLVIKFQQPPQDSVDTWSTERVKQWWEYGLPPACKKYIHIVDECQLDGSDLLDLDWEMLAEFNVRKIHGMKILKAIKNLMGSRQMLRIEVQRVVKQLEHWEVSPNLVSEVKSNVLHRFVDHNNGTGTGGEHGEDGTQLSEESDHGIGLQIWHFLAWPLEKIFAVTCPECEEGSDTEYLYPFTFLMSFLWVAVFSFLLSSVVERWVKVTHVPMSFFGLLLVSVAAQVPDTLESLAAARRGLGTMAVANCLSTQTINIALGLGLPWLITSSSGHTTELSGALKAPAYIMLIMLCCTLALYGSDVIAGYPRVFLTRTKAWILIMMYFLAIGSYAVYLCLT